MPGPVTLAIRAVRGAEPSPTADRAIEAIRGGLAVHFAEADRERVREMRRRIARRIQADIALLDALDGDPDIEAENEHGGDIQDQPHDPEEDGNESEIRLDVCGFDGVNYVRPRRQRPAGFKPGGLRVVGPDGLDYLVSAAIR